MCVPSVSVTGGKGKSVDYGASAWKGVFYRHLCGTGQPFALGVASLWSLYSHHEIHVFLCYNYKYILYAPK